MSLWLPMFLIFTLVHLASSNLSKLPLKPFYQFRALAAFVPVKLISAVILHILMFLQISKW